MHEHRRRRLLVLIEDHYGGDRKTFCDASGLSESRLAQLLSSSYREGQGFGEKAARALESRLGLNELYFDLLAAGETSVRHLYLQRAKPGARQDDTIHIRQLALKLTAGAARFTAEEVADPDVLLRFNKGWFREHDLQPDKLIAIAVTDASMLPRLSDGDVVVINTADTELKDGAVYAVNYNGEAVIKRMALDFGRWFLTSDNVRRKHYQRQEFVEKTCIVIGRVVFAASQHI